MEIWGVDLDGVVRGAFFEDGWKPANNWYSLDDGFKFPLETHLAALSRFPEHMEIWIVTDDKPIMGRSFEETGWRSWYQLDGEIFSPHTHIAAVKRHQTLHVFALDLNGHVRDNWFDGTSWRGWYQAGTEFFDQGIPLAAVSRRSDRLEVWAAAPNDIIRDDRFEVTQWQGWFPLQNRVFDHGTHIAALSRNEDHMEVWAVGQGDIRGNSFFDNAWHGWYELHWSFEG
jgi:hypothetical protein